MSSFTGIYPIPQWVPGYVWGSTKTDTYLGIVDRAKPFSNLEVMDVPGT